MCVYVLCALQFSSKLHYIISVVFRNFFNGTRLKVSRITNRGASLAGCEYIKA